MSMADQGDKGWQSDKTVLECNRYMLDNEIATDVCFEVGPPGGATVIIRAHKYMLISRSSFFQSMFTGGMAERNKSDDKIRIEDINAESFKELLSFIYCENVKVSEETVASLLAVGKKYMLPRLVKECGNYLEKSLNENNACKLLEQSLNFGDKDLTKKCLDVICTNSDHVLDGAEFPKASYDVIEAILRMDELESSELLVYESCIKWAKCQLKISQSVEDPTDQQIREMLGGLLYKIRFPIMDPEEFATIAGNSHVLSCDEKSSVYYYFLKRDNVDRLLFSVKGRMGNCPEVWIDRTVTCVSSPWSSIGQVDAVNFTIDKDIQFTGLGLYGAHTQNGYAVNIEIMQGSINLFKKEGVTVPFTGNSDPVKIPLDQPIKVTGGTPYTIIIANTTTSFTDYIGYYGDPCQAACKSATRNLTCTFSDAAVLGKINNCTAVRGQIPRLYFK